MATRERTHTNDFILVDYEIYDYVNEILDHSLYHNFSDKNRIDRGKYVTNKILVITRDKGMIF